MNQPTLADRIQQLRREHGLSQEQLAEKLNVSRQAVSKWESAQAQPELDKILALSELFCVTTDYLLKGSRGTPPEAGPAPARRLDAAFASRVLYLAALFFLGAGWFAPWPPGTKSRRPTALQAAWWCRALAWSATALGGCCPRRALPAGWSRQAARRGCFCRFLFWQAG